MGVFGPRNGTNNAVSFSAHVGVHSRVVEVVEVIEVAPPYDHAEITGIAASHVACDLVALLALRHRTSGLEGGATVAPHTEGQRA